MRSTAIVLCGALALAAGMAAAADDGVVAVCNGTSITASYSGINFGPTPVVEIWRRNLTDCGPWTLVASGFALPGQPVVVEAVDTGVEPDKLYRYSVAPNDSRPPEYPNATGGLTFFDDFVGCGNAPVAEGSVELRPDGAAVYTWAVPCPGSCYPSVALWTGHDLVTDYLDGDPVTIYGSVEWTLHLGWVLFATSAVPGDCTTIGVEAQAWSSVKRLYR